MRRWAILISLLAAFAGTPLRQVEAASDLSRSLAELCLGAEIESPDGGVGDDSGVGTLTAPHGHPAHAPAAPDLFFVPPGATPVPARANEQGLRERVWWPQAPPTLRHAWLQLFRF